MEQRGLVERAKHGDHDAFAALVTAAGSRLLGASCLILDDLELARDATQEALIRAWRDLPSLRDPDLFDRWLYRLTVNACLDLARRRKRRPIEVDLEGVDVSVPADPVGIIIDRQIIEMALRGLDPAFRAVVVLHYYVGLPLPDVARAVDIPLGTAKSRLHRALGVMRTAIGDTRAELPEPVGEGQLA